MELLGFAGWVKAIEPFFVWQGSVYNNCGFSYENLSTPIKIIYLSAVYGNGNHLSRRHYIQKKTHGGMREQNGLVNKGKIEIYTSLLAWGGWMRSKRHSLIEHISMFHCILIPIMTYNELFFTSLLPSRPIASSLCLSVSVSYSFSFSLPTCLFPICSFFFALTKSIEKRVRLWKYENVITHVTIKIIAHFEFLIDCCL